MPAHVPLKFAYWVPNVSGGLVTSTIEQRTYQEEVEYFGRNVLPIIREKEAELAARESPLVPAG